jgi:hypothetical protein
LSWGGIKRRRESVICKPAVLPRFIDCNLH